MEKKILATIEEAVHNGDTAGANVLVIKDGKESAYCGYGMREEGDPGLRALHVPL